MDNTTTKLTKWQAYLSSTPRIMLHIEALVVFIAAVAIYFDVGFGTVTFLVLILGPDVSLIGFAVNNKTGALAYDVAHFGAFPALLIAAGILGDWSGGVQIGLIWAAHIAMDRTLGFGLRYMDDSNLTHLQKV